MNLKDELAEEEILWQELLKYTKKRDRAIAEYNEKRTLKSIKNMYAVCDKFNKLLGKWRLAIEKEVRAHSVYIPAHK